jgi:hypothetical protein
MKSCARITAAAQRACSRRSSVQPARDWLRRLLLALLHGLNKHRERLFNGVLDRRGCGRTASQVRRGNKFIRNAISRGHHSARSQLYLNGSVLGSECRDAIAIDERSPLVPNDGYSAVHGWRFSGIGAQGSLPVGFG